MVSINQSSVSEFLLLGLSKQPQQQQLLFLLFFIMYLAIVLGNLLIILAISTDTRLHTPMYFFLSNLSFVDVCFSSTTVPKVQITSKILRTSSVEHYLSTRSWRASLIVIWSLVIRHL
ncbi:olfactory receptor 1361-like isoform X1 [Mastomys coucha]|uniref:olfactory receptor 1361-like isoform X1 n=1 Tax=Mastomys coucha TaxID=35658 RepID=UPI0012624FBD|nr:olfactory receptor 1361-like isoform X1 [Mastomys coucha]